jgi:hypothetical protein
MKFYVSLSILQENLLVSILFCIFCNNIFLLPTYPLTNNVGASRLGGKIDIIKLFSTR